MQRQGCGGADVGACDRLFARDGHGERGREFVDGDAQNGRFAVGGGRHLQSGVTGAHGGAQAQRRLRAPGDDREVGVPAGPGGPEVAPRRHSDPDTDALVGADQFDEFRSVSQGRDARRRPHLGRRPGRSLLVKPQHRARGADQWPASGAGTVGESRCLVGQFGSRLEQRGGLGDELGGRACRLKRDQGADDAVRTRLHPELHRGTAHFGDESAQQHGQLRA